MNKYTPRQFERTRTLAPHGKVMSIPIEVIVMSVRAMSTMMAPMTKKQKNTDMLMTPTMRTMETETTEERTKKKETTTMMMMMKTAMMMTMKKKGSIRSNRFWMNANR